MRTPPPAATNKNTTQVNLRWCLSYCLTAPCDGLSISSRFSQSFTWGGLACYGFWLTPTWRFRRAPRLEVLNFSEHSPLMQLVYRAAGHVEVPQWTFKIYALGNISSRELSVVANSILINKSRICNLSHGSRCWICGTTAFVYAPYGLGIVRAYFDERNSVI